MIKHHFSTKFPEFRYTQLPAIEDKQLGFDAITDIDPKIDQFFKDCDIHLSHDNFDLLSSENFLKVWTERAQILRLAYFEFMEEIEKLSPDFRMEKYFDMRTGKRVQDTDFEGDIANEVMDYRLPYCLMLCAVITWITDVQLEIILVTDPKDSEGHTINVAIRNTEDGPFTLYCL
jgi:hypothetical protein